MGLPLLGLAAHGLTALAGEWSSWWSWSGSWCVAVVVVVVAVVFRCYNNNYYYVYYYYYYYCDSKDFYCPDTCVCSFEV